MDNKTKKTDILLVDPSNIVIVGDNIRQDMGDLESLADSIQETGLQIPLKAKKVRGEDKYALVDGHRRFAAINILIKRGVDVGRITVVPYTGNDEDRLVTMLATGIGQKELTPIEQSEGVKRLTQMQYAVDEIAKKIGKSVPYIYHLLKLAGAPKEVKNLVAKGKVSVNVVVDIIRQTENSEQQTEMVKKVVEASEANGRTKATNRDMTKKPNPFQKLKELVSKIEEQDEKNEKMELFLTLFTRNKMGDTVDELFELFNS